MRVGSVVGAQIQVSVIVVCVEELLNTLRKQIVAELKLPLRQAVIVRIGLNPELLSKRQRARGTIHIVKKGVIGGRIQCKKGRDGRVRILGRDAPGRRISFNGIDQLDEKVSGHGCAPVDTSQPSAVSRKQRQSLRCSRQWMGGPERGPASGAAA